MALEVRAPGILCEPYDTLALESRKVMALEDDWIKDEATGATEEIKKLRAQLSAYSTLAFDYNEMRRRALEAELKLADTEKAQRRASWLADECGRFKGERDAAVLELELHRRSWKV